MMTRPQLLIIFPLLLFLQTACFEPTSGCLDINATNFDASADKDCCCKYPQLILDVSQHFGTETFTENAAYPAPLDNHLFRLKSVVFYLSDFQLMKNGNPYTIADTVQLRTFGPTLQDTVTTVFTDDFLLVRRLSFSNTVGTFQQDGTFESARVRLGLNDAAERVIPRLAPSGHPLRPQVDSLWHGPDVGYIFAQIVLTRDTFRTTPPDTISFSRADLGDFFIQTSAPVQHTTGYDFHLRLSTDYQALLEGVNLNIQDKTAWKARMLINLPGVFSVFQ